MVQLIVEKSKRMLTLLHEGETPRMFPISLGRSPLGHKFLEGDGRTPEGEYRICTRNAQSKYHRSLGLNYPSVNDARAALANGRIDLACCREIEQAHTQGRRPPWNTALGGFIMIHGGGAQDDWTQGCVALSNADMDVLFGLCPMGTPVSIRV